MDANVCTVPCSGRRAGREACFVEFDDVGGYGWLKEGGDRRFLHVLT